MEQKLLQNLHGKLHGKLPADFLFLKGIYMKNGGKLLAGPKIRGNGLKLNRDRLSLDIKRDILKWGW